MAQYVGRLHRRYAGKSDVLVVDYVDASVPVLARMAAKRRAEYRMLGYTIDSDPSRPINDLPSTLPSVSISDRQPAR
ncbi:hypothetical protein ACRQ5Q_44100 (plasmid) [Bradyrhizobium sp. PMVTL-01]|uniref:hypothetical protein n=1 Tax=Bradyrhizobium sp. PMVTL-01 TaxID=3434999 RepID=UPI003F6F10C9